MVDSRAETQNVKVSLEHESKNKETQRLPKDTDAKRHRSQLGGVPIRQLGHQKVILIDWTTLMKTQ